MPMPNNMDMEDLDSFDPPPTPPFYAPPPMPYDFPYRAPPTPPGPPPPRVARKAGKKIIWWPTDEGSLASRSIGKVNIDCRLRLSESKWGLLAGSQPAGILYVDLTFDQPHHCRLSSATVLISLEDCEESDNKKGKRKEREEEVTLSSLRVCQFGPRLLTGEPTTMKSKTGYSFTPEFNMGMAGAGGVGVTRENSIHRVSRWVLEGKTLAPDDKKRKTPGIVYRTLKWELTENQLAYQSTEKSTVHTAFAFAHELKRFYIKVEISGKLTNKLKYCRFPPSLKRDQGTLFTLVDVGDEDRARKHNLDGLANKLDDEMRDRNLIKLPTNIHGKLDKLDHQGEHKPSSLSERANAVNLADLAKATDKFPPTIREPPGHLEAGLRPKINSTPAPSFSSSATTLAPSQDGDCGLDVPPSPLGAGRAPTPTPTQRPHPGQKPEPRDLNRDRDEEKLSRSSKSHNEIRGPPPPDKYKKPTAEQVEHADQEDKAARVIAEVQFLEVLAILRAWMYAKFLAMFLRNQKQQGPRRIVFEERSRGKEESEDVL